MTLYCSPSGKVLLEITMFGSIINLGEVFAGTRFWTHLCFPTLTEFAPTSGRTGTQCREQASAEEVPVMSGRPDDQHAGWEPQLGEKLIAMLLLEFCWAAQLQRAIKLRLGWQNRGHCQQYIEIQWVLRSFIKAPSVCVWRQVRQ